MSKKTPKMTKSRLAKIKEMESTEDEMWDSIVESEIRDVISGLPTPGLNYTSRKETLCSKLRRIYQKTDDEQIKEWCIEATLMAKKITKRLKWYATKDK